MDRFEYVNATSVAEALSQLGEGRAFKAGGIDLLDRMKEGLSAPKRIVNLRTIAALDGIAIGEDGADIGPLTTLAAVASHDELRKRYAAVADAALMAATPQIRNMATAGGNLLQRPRCWYFRNGDTNCLRKGGDGCFAQTGANRYHAIFGNDICAMVHPSALAVPLTAFDAVVELTGAKAKRKTPISAFYLAPDVDPTREAELRPDEILTAIHLPPLRPGTRSAYVKQKERESADWPLADVAVVVEMRDGVVQQTAIVLGAVAAKPWRATGAEAELKGKRIDEALARRAAAAAVQGAKPLAGNAYKIAVVETIVRRAILEAAS